MRDGASLTGNNDDRARIGLNLISLAMELVAAILHLHSYPVTPLAGAARALVRPLLEAYIRGLWWCRLALDEVPEAKDQNGRDRQNINLYVDDDRGSRSRLWRWRDLLRELEDPELSQWLDGMLRQKGDPPGDPTIEETLNDWVHGGANQSKTGIGPQSIDPVYPREAQDFVVLFASSVGFLAACEVARFMSQPDAVAADLADIAGRYPQLDLGRCPP